MSRKCTICEHPDRKKIDKALVEPGAKLSFIALKFAVSKYALDRHVRKGHILEKIQKVRNAEEAAEIESFLQKIARKHRRFDELADEAKKKHDPHLELKVLREQAKYLDMEGKACGVYREKIEHSGPIGGPVKIKIINVEEEVKKIAHLLPHVEP